MSVAIHGNQGVGALSGLSMTQGSARAQGTAGRYNGAAPAHGHHHGHHHGGGGFRLAKLLDGNSSGTSASSSVASAAAATRRLLAVA